MYAQLKTRYLGQYVAIHKGQLVDTDADCGSLFLRIQKQYGDLIVLIRQVRETPDEVYHFGRTWAASSTCCNITMKPSRCGIQKLTGSPQKRS